MLRTASALFLALIVFMNLDENIDTPPTESSEMEDAGSDWSDDESSLLGVVLVASVDGTFHLIERATGHSPEHLRPRETRQYIIEPQSGDIYVLASPPETSPLRRFPHSMPQLVDMSPFTFEDLLFVGEKETFEVTIDLDTGNFKSSSGANSWREEWLKSGDFGFLTPEQIAHMGFSGAQEVSITRTDCRVAVHKRTSDKDTLVQNLSFSAYGPHIENNRLQAAYTKTEDDFYVQGLPSGEIMAFKSGVVRWSAKLSSPVIAAFDTVDPPGVHIPEEFTALLQPRPQLSTILPQSTEATSSHLGSVYVGLVEKTCSLFAMSPERFPLIAMHGVGGVPSPDALSAGKQQTEGGAASAESSDHDAYMAIAAPPDKTALSHPHQHHNDWSQLMLRFGEPQKEMQRVRNLLWIPIQVHVAVLVSVPRVDWFTADPIPFMVTLNAEVIKTDLHNAKAAYAALATGKQVDASEARKRISFAYVKLAADPNSRTSAASMASLWAGHKTLENSQAVDMLHLRLKRKGIMLKTYMAWHWLYDTCCNTVVMWLATGEAAKTWLEELTYDVKIVLHNGQTAVMFTSSTYMLDMPAASFSYSNNNTQRDGHGYMPFACWDWLLQDKPVKVFPGIGPLAAYLLAADYTYTTPQVMELPTANELGPVVASLNKGAVRGMEILGLVERAEEKVTGAECLTALKKVLVHLHRRLSTKMLTELSIDYVMVEHVLYNKQAKAKVKGAAAAAHREHGSGSGQDNHVHPCHIGLFNKQITCFMNSKLQILFGQPAFTNGLINHLNTIPTTYSLSAYITHVGGDLASGHYTAMAKRGTRWFCFDDKHVTKLAPQAVVNHKQAYILIYTKNTHPIQ
ncbi:hypothetical protein HMN09_00288200 [Mycena chlorophos]|uniref:USP domain-containing protein n=1 Tax=Mycena chlorophos TaxID=658473 RepID=A0A8H6WP76_MYCCL|nr:hypothetical protein HMN09_00288200 [Mycena chlorophos]